MRMYETLMASYGKSVGIEFKSGGKIANTLPAHSVIQQVQTAHGPETAGRLVNALYKRFFEEAAHPSSDETLVAACVEAGVDESEARRLVGDKDENLRDVKAAIQEQRMNGIDSVPTVMIEGRRRDITLVGAKEVAEYVKALTTIAKESV